MARDLEADLKLCEAADTGAAWLHRDVFAAAAREGWRETIRELMEARKRIAELESRLEVLTPCDACDGKGWVYDPEDGGTMCCPECGE